MRLVPLVVQPPPLRTEYSPLARSPISDPRYCRHRRPMTAKRVGRLPFFLGGREPTSPFPLEEGEMLGLGPLAGAVGPVGGGHSLILGRHSQRRPRPNGPAPPGPGRVSANSVFKRTVQGSGPVGLVWGPQFGWPGRRIVNSAASATARARRGAAAKEAARRELAVRCAHPAHHHHHHHGSSSRGTRRFVSTQAGASLAGAAPAP